MRAGVALGKSVGATVGTCGVTIGGVALNPAGASWRGVDV